MELEKFVRNFAEQFEDTELEVFKSGTAFKDLDEWSSLMALSIIAMVDEEYGIVLKGEDIRNANTIEDLFKIVESKK